MTFLLMIMLTGGSPRLPSDTRGTDRPPVPVSAPADSLIAAGNRYELSGDLEQAAASYERSLGLRDQADPATLKRLGDVYGWMRKYSLARSAYERALELRPGDGEASSAIDAIRAQRSIHLMTSLGGGEPDYAKNVSQFSAFAGSVDWLDLYGRVSFSDRVFYQRKSVSADAYLFPSYGWYIRLGGGTKEYSYDLSAPDVSAYVNVPDLQGEVGFSLGQTGQVSVEGEYFAPNFYYNNAMRAKNVKLSASYRQKIGDEWYGKVFGALLRDPDPASMSLDPASNRLLSFSYEQVALAGAAVGYDQGHFSGEVKYIPDRDLDQSISWSVFTYASYRWGTTAIRYDWLLDKYSTFTTRAFGRSQVHMVTFSVSPSTPFDVQGGLKALSRDVTEVMPFVSVRFRTGL